MASRMKQYGGGLTKLLPFLDQTNTFSFFLLYCMLVGIINYCANKKKQVNLPCWLKLTPCSSGRLFLLPGFFLPIDKTNDPSKDKDYSQHFCTERYVDVHVANVPFHSIFV